MDFNGMLKGVVGAALGQKSDTYSRKWIVVALCAIVAVKFPAFVPAGWLIQIITVWIGAQGAADVAAVFKKPAA